MLLSPGRYVFVSSTGPDMSELILPCSDRKPHHLVDNGLRAHDPGKTNIGNLGYSRIPKKDVGALQVHVHNSSAVQEVHATSDI